MADSLDMTSLKPALKEIYTDMKVENLVYKNNPALALMPKREDFGGDTLRLPIIFGNPQGRSATFSKAQTNRTSSKLKKFNLVRVHDYAVATIDNETLLASRGKPNSFLDAVVLEMDGAFQAITNSVAHALYRSGSGSLGKIASIGSDVGTNDKITLTNANDIVFFEVGMTLAASTADGGGSVKNLVYPVIKVDRDAGTITVTGNVTTSTAWAQNDYLFVEGDYDQKLSGFGAWCPASAPTSALFFGVDRTADSRLGGLRKDISNLPIEEGLIDGVNRAAREGASLDYIFMNHNRYAQLEKALGSKIQYVNVDSQYANIGFRGIQLHGTESSKMITVIPDRNCPDTQAFGMQLDVWTLASLGKLVSILDTDGNRMLRQTNEDGIELRVGGYFQAGCRAPGWNINLKLA